jgi:hypothetical protein
MSGENEKYITEDTQSGVQDTGGEIYRNYIVYAIWIWQAVTHIYRRTGYSHPPTMV